MEVYHIIPLVNAVIFTLGALCIKRATTYGVGPWRSTFFSNLVLFFVALPLWFFGEPMGSWTDLWMPLLVAAVFFVGQLLACLAIHKGDVTLLTPLLGTKTVMVAFMVSIGLGEALSASVWIGAVLSAVAILLMRGVTVAERRRVLPSIYLGLGCSFFYAGNDVLIQAFGAELGFHRFVASIFTFVALLSFSLVPLFRSPMRAITGATWLWMAGGALLMAAQASGMAFVMSTYGKAAVVNVIYSSRGIWSVVIVWFVGHWFSNRERALGGGVMARRLLGSVLLIASIVAVVRSS